MTKQDDKIKTIREFIARDDLEGTDFKLKEQIVSLDLKANQARLEEQKLTEDFQSAQQAVNNKRVEVMALAERLDGLCDLVVDLTSDTE